MYCVLRQYMVVAVGAHGFHSCKFSLAYEQSFKKEVTKNITYLVVVVGARLDRGFHCLYVII